MSRSHTFRWAAVMSTWPSSHPGQLLRSLQKLKVQ